MPLPTTPMKVTCRSCGWSKIIPQQGDVIFKPSQCERCGSGQLSLASAGVLDELSPATFIRKIFNKY